MSKFGSLLRSPVLLASIVVAASSTGTHAALSASSGTGGTQSGHIWLYFAAFVLGTLGLAFMPSKRREADK